MIAREPTNPVAIPGLGLEIDHDVSKSEVDPLLKTVYGPDTLGVRLRSLLRALGQSFMESSDENKILWNVFAMDGYLTPANCRDAKQFRQFIGVSASKSSNGYELEYKRFDDFYKSVRDPLVHHGKSYRDLKRTRKIDLLYLQGLIFSILTNLMPLAAEPFQDVWDSQMALARQHLKP
jgi:hypothetical protein